MHVFTHLKPESLGKTGKGIHADGMVEHDLGPLSGPKRTFR
jgi:arylsulfatase